MARQERQRTLSEELNRTVGGGRNFNGGNDREQVRMVTKRNTTEGGATRVVKGAQQFGSRKQRYRDIRVAFGLTSG